MNDTPIECNSLTKRFGDLTAVDGLTFGVEPGSVTGFVGHNGAGKTTTLRMLLGLARPTQGEAYLLGSPCGRKDRSHLSRVGYLPESPAFYRWMTPRGFLSFCGQTMGLTSGVSRSRADEVTGLFGLSAKADRKIGGFSKGEKQRLGLAQAMMGDPELLILDEPTSGLDPLGRHELLSLVEKIRGGQTIFFSSHILEDVEKVCDRVVMIGGGRLLEEGTVGEVIERHSEPGFTIRVRAGAEDLARALQREEWVGNVTRADMAVTLTAPDTERAETELPRLISALGIPLQGLETTRGSLVDVYIKLTEAAGSE